jgi:hypothetical protein
MRNCASGNLEIPDRRFAPSGMTPEGLASVHPALVADGAEMLVDPEHNQDQLSGDA